MTSLPTIPIEPAPVELPGAPAVPMPPPGSTKRRIWKERALCQAAAAMRLVGRGAERPLPGMSATGIVTYHHIAKTAYSDPHLLNVTPARFREQIEGLLRRGYVACSLREIVACHQNQQAAADKSFAVVFDDGHHSVYDHAWPVLRQLRVPATIFLATAYLDSGNPFPFDVCQTAISHCGDTRRPLTTLECEEMLASGLIDLGSHTHTHEDFRGQPARFELDLTDSLQLLRDRFGLEQVTFSFPYGRFDAEMQRILREHGVLCGLTAECRRVTLGGAAESADRFAWGRFGATQLDTSRTLAAKLDGWYTWLQQGWRKLRGAR